MSHLDWELSAFLDGELAGDQRRAAAEHVLSCSACRAELDETAAIRARVRGLPMLEAPSGLLPAPVFKPFHRRRSVWVGAVAAVAAITIGVATITAPATQVGTVDDLARRFGARQSLDPTFSPTNAVPNLETGE